MKRMNSIGFKLTALMLGIVLLGILITFGVAVVFSSNVITNESLEKVHKSTQYEAERLDSWLSVQTTTMNTVADVLSGMDDLADIVAANRPDSAVSLEEQTVDMLKPYFESVLDGNDAFFETYMGFPDGTAVTGSGFQFDYEGGWFAPERSWYGLALTDTARAHVTSPYIDAQTGEFCVSVSQAVMRDGNVIGVMGADVFVTELQDITLAAASDATGYSMLVDANGDIFVHPDAEYAPKVAGDLLEVNNLATIMDNAYADMWATVSSSEGIHEFKDANGVSKYYTSSVLPTTGWYLVTALPTAVVTQPVTNLILIVVPISILILVAAATIIFLTIRNSVSRPLMPITTFFSKAGLTGDFSLSQAEIDSISNFSKRKDEFGQLTVAATGFVNHVNEISKALEMVANNDLTPEFSLLSEKDTMGNSLHSVLDNLNDMFKGINAASDQVSTGSNQVADGAQALAQGSTEQTASIEELSGAIAQVSAKTTENAERAEHAAKLTLTIKNNAEKGSRHMSEMMAAVNDINQASQGIEKVMKVINDIAFQTNILALNAAVEAARAGQHGKGFAVVADEVRNLAAKSAEAAKDTESLIANSMEKAALGVSIAGETAESLKEIVSGIGDSGALISDIAGSSREQSSAISQINVGIDQVATVVQQNSATAEESAAASEEMSGQSAMLRKLIAQFRIKGDATAQPALPVKSSRRQVDASDETGFLIADSHVLTGKY